MTYRVRRQRLTGKLILQHATIDFPSTWTDCFGLAYGTFSIIDTDRLRELEARISKYERRAAGQRKANEARKAAAAARAADTPF